MYDTYTSGASWDKSVLLLPAIALSMHRRYSVIIGITLNFIYLFFCTFLRYWVLVMLYVNLTQLGISGIVLKSFRTY